MGGEVTEADEVEGRKGLLVTGCTGGGFMNGFDGDLATYGFSGDTV
jgi:hypothetical protein